jgi:hypothetical protein
LLVVIDAIELPRRSIYTAEIQGDNITIGGVSEIKEDVQKLKDVLGAKSVGMSASFYVENKRYTARGYGIILDYKFEDKSDEANSSLTYRLTIRASRLG